MTVNSSPSPSDSSLHSYYTTKITRWKGNYPRIFTLSTHGLTTFNPGEPATSTNHWQWTDVFAMSPASTPDHPFAFQLTHRKGNSKTDTMKFECEQRDEILTFALEQWGLYGRSWFTEGCQRGVVKFENGVGKYRHGSAVPSGLRSLTVTPYGLEQVSAQNEKKIYYFKDMEAVIEVEGGNVAIKMKEGERHHFYSSPNSSQIIAKIVENSSHFIGHTINLTRSQSIAELLPLRFGLYSSDAHVTSLAEFTVQNSTRSRVLLCLTESCLIERDPVTYTANSLTPFSSIFALIRSPDDSQGLTIEFKSTRFKDYFSTERDALLASLLDGARSAGNMGVCVKGRKTPVGKRWGPLGDSVDEKVESLFLKFIHQPPPGWNFNELLIRFNANVEYSGLVHSSSSNGLFAENKEKLILVAINALIARDVLPLEYEEYFHAVRRLVCSKTGFSAFGEMQGFREKLGALVVAALRAPATPDTTIHAALEVISALMQPMHATTEVIDLRSEQENKEKVLSSPTFLESLLDMWTGHIARGTGALVTISMLDILTWALCAPYSETTLGAQFDGLLEKVATRSSVLFELFQHKSLAIVKGAGLLMKSVIEEGQGTIPQSLQDAALREGALLRHLVNACFVSTTDPRLLTLRQLSRHLISLWTSGHAESMDLLKRVFPPGLLRFLADATSIPPVTTDAMPTRNNLAIASSNMPTGPSPLAQVEKFLERHIEPALRHWALASVLESRKRPTPRPVALRKRRQNVTLQGNWPWFYYNFAIDHASADLLWNFGTREELKQALNSEIRLLEADRDHVRTDICWNYSDFSVVYKSLDSEVQVSGYYVRILLERGDFECTLGNVREFFAELYHRFLLSGKEELRAMCLEAMALVYDRYSEIGVFGEVKFVVLMLEKSTSASERDRLLRFLLALTKNQENARQLVTCGLKTLVDLLPLAHLTCKTSHRNLLCAQTNLLEDVPEARNNDSPEWYYMKGGQKQGPVGFIDLKKLYKGNGIDAKTKVWASGLDSWKALVNVPQCRWFIVHESEGNGLLDGGKMATTILDILIQVISFCPSRIGNAVVRPVHKAKQILTDMNTCFPHIVQLLLTFDPDVVERVARLLCMLLDSNPLITPRIYLTGVYFFILMYTGSNILPISRFLSMTHMQQNAVTFASQSPYAKSILHPLLPEALIAYLENHGEEKFSEIFLGEFDTPEAIWSSDMRRHLIERISVHIAEFTPRLKSNTRALYDYCAIPAVAYDVLENELFCGVYYLRNLTDENRFPSWPINSPLSTLRDILTAWRDLVSDRPPEMTVVQALSALDLEDTPDWPEQVKRAYRKMAARFHPDKNPEGRDRFEQANKAYEFLCSRRGGTGADKNKMIGLVLKAQSILFKRYSNELSPYKYSGYPMLIKTIEMELADEELFAKEDSLLAYSIELVYWTLNCSELNVEELRREGGLDLLLAAFDRCVAQLPSSPSPTHEKEKETLSTLVCCHVMRCFSVATKFQLCRDKLVELPQLAVNICRVLQYKHHLPTLAIVGSEAVTALSVDTILQMHLLRSGVLWHLLTSMFGYDYTLEDSNIAMDSSPQLIINNLAKATVIALRGLSGDENTGSPRNDVVRTGLDKLLLPYGREMLLNSPPEETLKILNSNTISPYLIWDNSTRAELLDYCEQQLRVLRSGDISDMTYGSDFTYSAHEKELVIGPIFIRIYNSSSSSLTNPSGFIESIIAFLNEDHEEEKTKQALIALANAIKTNPGSEVTVKGRFRQFAKLLYIYPLEVVSVLQVLFVNQELVADSIGSGITGGLLVLILRTSNEALINEVLQVLTQITADKSNGVKEAFARGTHMVLLSLFSYPSLPLNLRTSAASLLANITGTTIPTTARARGSLLSPPFSLPSIFLDALEEAPETAVALFDSDTENPELLWKQANRDTLRNILATEKQELLQNLSHNPNSEYQPTLLLQSEIPPTELPIGGIYLSLYVQNPNWNVRKPKEFLKDLLEEAFKSDSELCCKSLEILLTQQPHLSDNLLPMGYVEKSVDSMVKKQVSSVIFKFLTRSQPCIDTLVTFDSITPVSKALQSSITNSHTQVITNITEGLNYLYEQSNVVLIEKALKCEIIPVLLSLLKGKDQILAGSAAGVKASVANCLQNMARNAEVEALLEKSEVWGMWRGQRHDLFLEQKPLGYLTSGSSSGYLTMGPGDSGRGKRLPPEQ